MNLKKWDDRRKQCQDEMKEITISQSVFDLEQQKDVTVTGLIGKITNLTSGFVKATHAKIDLLPHPNWTYITAGIIFFFSKADPDFFLKKVFNQSKEQPIVQLKHWKNFQQ